MRMSRIDSHVSCSRILTIVSLILLAPEANGQWTDDSACLLEEMPVVLLAKDSATGEFVLVDDGDHIEIKPKDDYTMSDEILTPSRDDGPSDRRGLSLDIYDLEFSTYISTDDFLGESSLVVPGLTVGTRTRNSKDSVDNLRRVRRRNLIVDHGGMNTTNNETVVLDNTTTSTLPPDDNTNSVESNNKTMPRSDSPLMRYRARECSCFVPDYPVVYCPLTVKTCNRPSRTSNSNTVIPGCLTSPKGRDQAKQVNSFVTIWLGILFFSVILTDRGHQCIRYIISSTCYPQCDKRTADKMMDDPETRDEAMAMINHHMIRERRRRRQRVANLSNQSQVANMAVSAADSTLGAAGGNLQQQIEMSTINNTNNNNRNMNTNTNINASGIFRLTTTTAPLALSARAARDPAPNGRPTTARTNQQQAQQSNSLPPTLPKSLVLHTKLYHYSPSGLSEMEERSRHSTTPGKTSTSYRPQQSKDAASRMSSNISCASSSKISSSEGAGIGEGITACTICLVALKDGDRVGALPCDHLFHVKCLKSWLPRRNVCPLCQNDQVATPVYDDNENNQNKSCCSSRDDGGDPSGAPASIDNASQPSVVSDLTNRFSTNQSEEQIVREPIDP